ncbi:MAG: UDP-N-acetylmuramoyl-L-alanyl-D-glutamate--2,6-diaminopimelate ligase [Candidatus Aminicenantes bacterium]|nr:UDP-N-acetylmuramoyl-L-alanyl-D-glutamate--2,6-diaminopimelate ligase [Candidatus Aminicenantes bacterium]
MTLQDLLAGVPVLFLSGDDRVEIRGIAFASKDVRPGDLFAALKGLKADGNDFVADASARGAAAVLSERARPLQVGPSWVHVQDAREALALCAANFYGHPSDRQAVVGVTGTKGKTTVTYVLEEIVRAAGGRPGVLGTISYRGPGLEVEAGRTTPEAPDLQRYLRTFLDGGGTHTLIEVSSHALELKRVWGVSFDVVAFTNLSGEHLDYHASMEEYFEAKKKLFFLDHKKNTAVVNMDDAWGRRLLAELPMRTVSYGFEPAAIVRAVKPVYGRDGIRAGIEYPGGTLRVESRLVGRHNLYNILAAAASALSLNLPAKAVEDGIAGLAGVPGRFERVPNARGIQVVVDYAHTDNALHSLLECVRAMKPRRIILVFGCGGNRDATKRARMGEVAGRLADWTIITSDNPRQEDPLAIIAAIEAGVLRAGSKAYAIQPDRRLAIRGALDLARKGDYVLIAGKGHEKTQTFKDGTVPFDDVAVAREMLGAEGEA